MRFLLFSTMAFVPIALVAAQAQAPMTEVLDPRSGGTHTTSSPASTVTPPACVPKSFQSSYYNRQIWDKFFDLLLIKKDALRAYAYASEGYIQHNPFIPDGRNATLDVLTQLLPRVKTNNFIKLWDDQKNIGTAHYRLDGYLPGPTALADMFKFKGGCIVEHWDVIQELPANATNPHPLW